MKRLFLLACGLLAAATASAEGYQVNTLSAKQSGMGHVGTGMKLDAESIHFNPAATAFQRSKFDISVGITGIKSDVTYTGPNDYTGAQPIKAYSDNKISITSPPRTWPSASASPPPTAPRCAGATTGPAPT